MQSEFKLGFSFIGFGLFSMFGMSTDTPAGQVVVIIMGIVFIGVGALYTWIGFKKEESKD
jgi:hypothetical protein